MKEKTSTRRIPKRHDIWLVRFPFSDLASTKVRPALVLAVHGEDVIVAGVFSRIPRGQLRKTWVRIEEGDTSFLRSGLKKTSLLRAEKLAVVDASVLVRKLGSLSPVLAKRVRQALRAALHLD